MDDSLLVRGLQRIADLSSDGKCFIDRDDADFDSFRECWPFDQLHYQVVGTNVVNLAYIGVIQSGHSTDFALESIAEVLGGNLDRHLPPHARIAGSVHLAHAAGPNGREDLIRSQASSGRERHIDLSDFTPPNCLIADPPINAVSSRWGASASERTRRRVGGRVPVLKARAASGTSDVAWTTGNRLFNTPP